MKTNNRNSIANRPFIANRHFIAILLPTLLFVFVGLPVRAAAATDDPANAFPADTLFFAEVRDPAGVLETVRDMPFWPEFEKGLREIVDPRVRIDDEFIRRLSAAAGKSLVVGLIPEPVFALRSGGNMLRSESLAWLTDRLAPDGIRCKVCDAGAWQVVCPSEVTQRAVEVALALAHRTANPQGTLAGRDDYRYACRHLPKDADARAFININVINQKIPTCEFLSDTGKRLLTACLGWMDGVGIARKITPESIQTWISGRLNQSESGPPHMEWMKSLTEIHEPVMDILPSNVLASYEAALPFDRLLPCMGSMLQSAFPTWYERICEGPSECILSPSEEMIGNGGSLFGPTTAFSWLPVSDAEPRWPFPRTVILIPVTDRAGTDRLMTGITDRIISALAPWSEGLFGARRVEENYDGVRILGLEVNSLLSFSMPSPAWARVDDLLIVSPVRSAVEEMIDALRGHTETLARGESLPPNTIEHFYVNPKAWVENLNGSHGESGWEFCVTSCGLLMLKTRYLCEAQKEMQKLRRMGGVFLDVVKYFEPSEGHTLYEDDGGYTFYMELPIARSRE